MSVADKQVPKFKMQQQQIIAEKEELTIVQHKLDDEFDNLIQTIDMVLKDDHGKKMFERLAGIGFMPSAIMIEEFKKNIEDPESVDIDEEVTNYKLGHIKTKLEQVRTLTTDWGIRDLHKLIFNLCTF